MSKKVITISREFGSGGRTIARMVAERLGYAFYDKALVERIAKESGYSEDFIERRGEDATSTSSFLFNLARSGSGGYEGVSGISDKLYVIQHNLIKRLPEEGPCVIVGRCSDYILKDFEDSLHVFIYADTQFKADRIVRLYGEREDLPEKRLEEKDKKRKVYYKNYTGRVWGMSTNYDISLNSGKIGVENCADIIVDLATRR
ncbi:MAG: cytidylate kinase-like family protein [Clostridiales bacterium]|jgi:cytidylate kinase|nr:cytidylate kinase-like family protein [Clostridiales bacterium]